MISGYFSEAIMRVLCSISETTDHRSGPGFSVLWFHYFCCFSCTRKDRGQIVQTAATFRFPNKRTHVTVFDYFPAIL